MEIIGRSPGKILKALGKIITEKADGAAVERRDAGGAWHGHASQEIAKQYGANFTPEFFVLDRDRKVVYMGAMDDKSPPAEPKEKHLEAALKAALAGKPAPTGETSAGEWNAVRIVCRGRKVVVESHKAAKAPVLTLKRTKIGHFPGTRALAAFRRS